MVRKNKLICLLIGLGMLLALGAAGKTPPVLYNLEGGYAVDQIDPYEADWRRVDSLMEQGAWLPASRTLEDLYFRVKRDQADMPLAKCLIYRINLLPRIESRPDSAAIVALISEIGEVREPVRQLLQSLLADLYLQYLQNHRAAIAAREENRSSTAGFPSWRAADFHREIMALYDASLQPAAYLRQLPVSAFRVILTPEGNAAHLRPSVYDLLAHRALAYFMRPDPDSGSKPDFAPAGIKLMTSATAFLQTNLKSLPLPENDRRSMEIFQQLLAFHYLREETAALLDVELQRLRYLRSRLPAQDTGDRYLDLLKQLADQYVTHPVSTEVQYEIAQYHRSRGLQYRPRVAEDFRWELRKAREACRKAIARYPQSAGAAGCQRLLQMIERPQLEMEIEAVQLPGKPFRAWLEFANLDTVQFQVFRIPDSERVVSRPVEAWRLLFADQAPIQAWQVALPNAADYQHHAAEIPMPALTPGAYLLVVSQVSAGEVDNPVQMRVLTQVSAISLYFRQEGGLFQVVDRQNGKPLAGVEASVAYWSEQDSAYAAPQNYFTDASGALSLGIRDSVRYARLDLRSKGDRYIAGPLWIDPGSTAIRQPQETRQLSILTDRAVYHPGDRIWFKAMLMETEGHDMRAVAGGEMELLLVNNSGLAVDTVRLRSNRFGLAAGSLLIPHTGWGREMTLRGEEGRTQIQVEMGAAPAPELLIRMDSFATTALLGEALRLRGSVRDKSGDVPAGLRLSYRVQRSLATGEMPWSPAGAGEIARNAAGFFEWEYVLAPGSHAGLEAEAWTYRVELFAFADQGAYGIWHTQLFAAARTLLIDAAIPDIASPDQLREAKISTRRPNGEFVPARVRLRIYPLEMPDRIFRPRRWAAPDLQLISEGDYRALFPHDMYAHETDIRQWKRGKMLMARVFDTSQSLQMDLAPMDTAAQGAYLMELFTLDDRGQEVLAEKYFTLYQPRQKETTVPAWLEIYPRRVQAAPGETVSLTIGSKEKNRMVLMTTFRGNGSVDTRYIKVGPRRKRISLVVPAAYPGNMEVIFSGVLNNVFYEEKIIIEVRRPDRELEIDFLSIDTLLQPGEKANWELTARTPLGIEPEVEWTVAWLDPASRPDFVLPRAAHQGLRLKWQRDEGFGRVPAEPAAQEHRYTDSRLPPRAYPRIAGWGGRGSEATADAHGEAEAGAAFSEVLPPRRYVLPAAFGVEKNAEKRGFFPQLLPNERGTVVLDMPVPQQVGAWRLMVLAHTPDGRFAMAGRNIQVRKELAVKLDGPVFLRQGDEVLLSARITHLKEQPVAGMASLEVLDAASGQPLPGMIVDGDPQAFRLSQGGMHLLQWRVRVTEAIPALLFRLRAQAGGLSDVAEYRAPVFADQQYVATSVPMMIPGKSTRRFFVETDIQPEYLPVATGKETINLEFSSHPAWYAVRALQELAQPRFGDTREIFYRYAGQWLGRFTVGQSPRLAQWLAACSAAADSMCESWADPAPDDAAAVRELLERQDESGGFVPFPGLAPSRDLTRQVVTHWGRLQQDYDAAPHEEMTGAMTAALAYLDQQIKQDYERLTRNAFNTRADNLGEQQIQYLYMRSFFRDIPRSYGSQIAYDYYFNQTRLYWKQQPPALRAMIALILYRNGEAGVARQILQSLRRQAQQDETRGIFWDISPGDGESMSRVAWHALLMEAFWEIDANAAEVEQMSLWLLAQRRGTGWQAPESTFAAASVLLMTGKSWLQEREAREGEFSQLEVSDAHLSEQALETGSGLYYQSAWKPTADAVQSGSIVVRQAGESTVWGSLSLRSLEANGVSGSLPVSIERSFFLIPEGKGPLRRLEPPFRLRPGDRVKVQIRLRTDKTLYQVQLQTAEAATFTPEDERVGVHDTGNLAYYRLPGTAATYYFFERIPTGVYQIEYTLRAGQKGLFHQGYLRLSSLTAPERETRLPGETFRVED